MTDNNDVTIHQLQLSQLIICNRQVIQQDYTRKIIPVSYTHLDVYKRQIYVKVECIHLNTK